MTKTTRLTRISLFLAMIASWLAAILQPSLAQQTFPPPRTAGVERLYVLYCGDIALNDASSFTPGASGPGALSDTCYLIKHAQDWVLWDTGLPDSLVGMPDGMKSNAGVWTSKKTLMSQLAELDLKPSDIHYLALSHSHPDHVGNLNLFPRATLVVQKAEYDWAQPFGGPRFKPEQPAIKAEGDRDLFGDGSVVLISTPGHSPGHQCLAGPAAQNGNGAPFRGRRPHQGQLGQPPRTRTQFQYGPIARFARPYGGCSQGEQCAALDRPRD